MEQAGRSAELDWAEEGWAEPLSQDTGNVIFQMAAILVVLEMSLNVLPMQRGKDMWKTGNNNRLLTWGLSTIAHIVGCSAHYY